MFATALVQACRWTADKEATSKQMHEDIKY